MKLKVYKKKKAPSLSMHLSDCSFICTLTNPMLLNRNLTFVLLIVSSQLQNEDTLLKLPFPNFLCCCFAPVMHLVMHIHFLSYFILYHPKSLITEGRMYIHSSNIE